MATRADVARLAGVSASTVSYALSGDRPISEATRQRILSAMVELGYSPNLLAAGLAGGRSRLLALLFPSRIRGISNADLEYVLGAANAARELGYHVVLWPTDEQDLDEVQRVSKVGLVDGVILMEVLLDDPRVPLLQQGGIPFALIGRTRESAGLTFADQDFDETAHIAIGHLASLGHGVVAFVNGPDRLLASGYGATVRADAAMRSAAAAAGVQLVSTPCEHDVSAGRSLLDELIAKGGVTGIVAMNDEATIGFVHQARHRGVRIPEDLSVLSVSASAERAEMTSPALSTISPQAGEIGRAAARALISTLVGDPAISEPVLWAGTLVERGSTAPAAATGKSRAFLA